MITPLNIQDTMMAVAASLHNISKMCGEDAELKKHLGDAQTALGKMFAHPPKTEEEIKDLRGNLCKVIMAEGVLQMMIALRPDLLKNLNKKPSKKDDFVPMQRDPLHFKPSMLPRKKQKTTTDEPHPAPVGTIPAAAHGRVTLFDQTQAPKVNNREKQPLTDRQYAIIKALLEAGDNGMAGVMLDIKSGKSYARKDLKKLAESDPDWKEVIHFPKVRGEGYKIG